MTHKGGRLLSTLVCFLFSYLTLTLGHLVPAELLGSCFKPQRLSIVIPQGKWFLLAMELQISVALQG